MGSLLNKISNLQNMCTIRYTKFCLQAVLIFENSSTQYMENPIKTKIIRMVFVPTVPNNSNNFMTFWRVNSLSIVSLTSVSCFVSEVRGIWQCRLFVRKASEASFVAWCPLLPVRCPDTSSSLAATKHRGRYSHLPDKTRRISVCFASELIDYYQAFICWNGCIKYTCKM